MRRPFSAILRSMVSRDPNDLNRGPEWPPLYWRLIAFLGGLFLMLNHFHDQGIRYRGSEVLLRALAIWVSPALLCTAGILAMVHVGRVRHLVTSSLLWCAVAVIPLILLEDGLFPAGHGVSEGTRIALGHLPFVGVFLAGLWSAGKLYRTNRHKLLAILLPAPAGYLFGSALVYVLVFTKRVGFHWQRCRDAEDFTQFLRCFF
jgi:hypothetical protein